MPGNQKTSKRRNNAQKRVRPRRRRQQQYGDAGIGVPSRFHPTLARTQSVAGVQLTKIPLNRIPHLQRGQLYHEAPLTLHSTGGLAAHYFFRANDVYDPNATGTGHQPMGFDQMMLLFEQFYVIGSAIRVKFSEVNSKSVIVGIAVSPDQTVISNSELQECGLIKSTEVNAYFGDKGCTEIRMKLNNPNYFGLTSKTYIANPNFQGTVAASPVEMNYWDIFAYPMNGTDTPTDVQIEVTLSYDVFYQEPRKLVESLSASEDGRLLRQQLNQFLTVNGARMDREREERKLSQLRSRLCVEAKKEEGKEKEGTDILDNFVRLVVEDPPPVRSVVRHPVLGVKK